MLYLLRTGEHLEPFAKNYGRQGVQDSSSELPIPMLNVHWLGHGKFDFEVIAKSLGLGPSCKRGHFSTVDSAVFILELMRTQVCGNHEEGRKRCAYSEGSSGWSVAEGSCLEVVSASSA
jgi:hypothetical protein